MPLRTLFSRETRLLVTTVIVAVGVLLLLARYRFPQPSEGPATIVARPLDRWVASTSYDELAAAVDDTRLRLSPVMEVLQVEPPLGAGHGTQGDGPRYVPALRFRVDRAMAVVPTDFDIRGIVGFADGSVTVVGRDPGSGLTVVQVPEKPLPGGVTSALPPQAPVYLAEALGTPSGTALRPLFAARMDAVVDPRWDTALLGLHPALDFSPGRLLFTMQGRLAGMTVRAGSSVVMVSAAATLARAQLVSESGPAATSGIGVTVQALTPSVARAVGATAGVVVRAVGADGPAQGLLHLGDVIEAINGSSVRTLEEFEHRVASAPPDTKLQLRIVRFSLGLDVEVTTAALGEESVGDDLGLATRPVSTGIEITSVRPRSAASRAGLVAGDVITQVGAAVRPRPADVDAAYAKLPPGSSLLLGVVRQQDSLVVGLDKP